jgi:hypothetical protein
MKILLKGLLLDTVIAVIFFTQITGCTTTADRDLLNDPSRYRLFVPRREQIVTNASIPSLEMEHFEFDVQITAEWSNGYQEEIILGRRFESREHYVLLALELNPKQKSEDITLKLLSFGDESVPQPRERSWPPPGSGAGLGPLLAIFILVMAPIWIYKLMKPKSKPFDGCCFVWAASVESGQTIDGESPPGMKLVLPQTKASQLEGR